MEAIHKDRLVRGFLLTALLVVPVTSSHADSQSATAARPSQVSQAPKQQEDYIPQPPAYIESKRIQFEPRGSDSYLIWSERSVAVRPIEDTGFTMGATFDVMGLDLRTNKSFVVSNAPNNQTDPQISGSIVVWQDNRHSCSTCEYDIVAKDLAADTEFQVATGPVDQAQPAIAGKTVVWVEGDGKTDRLMAKDLDTGRVTEIVSVSRSTNSILQPLVSEEYIVWSQLGEDNQDTRSYPVQLRLYDRITGTTKTIAEFGISFGDSPQIALDGHRLLWQGLTSLNLTDLKSGQTSALFQGRAFRPVIRGNKALWAVSPDGANGFDIYGLDLAASDPRALIIMSGGNTTGEAALAGDQFIWQNKSGPDDSHINAIPVTQAFASAKVAQQQMLDRKGAPSVNQESQPVSPMPGLTPGPGGQLPEIPDYTNYNSKGIHAANGDFGWYNNGIYPTACDSGGGCPAVDALGATQGTPFFGAVTALSSDLDRYTTTNSSGTNIRPTSPWGPQVKNAMRQMSNLGKRVTIRLFPTRYPNTSGSAYPDQIAQDVLGLAWRNWMINQNVMVNNEPNNEREWQPSCYYNPQTGHSCYWPGSADYVWDNYDDLRFYQAVNDWYVSAWWAINYYKNCSVNPTSCNNLQTMKMWTPPFAPLLGTSGQSKYTTVRGMLSLYGYFTYNLYADPYYQGNYNGLSNEDWSGFDSWLQDQIANHSSTFHSQINEFGWDPYTMANANCQLTQQHTWPSSGLCRAQDGVTHTLSDDATKFLNNGSERHNAEALHVFIIRGGGNNDNDGLDPNGSLWYSPLGTWRWLYNWQRASPNP